MSLGGHDTVAAVIVHRVREGREADYRAWLDGIAEAARGFPGHVSATVVRPDEPGGPWTNVLQFEDAASLDGWLSSDERAAWVRRVDPMIEGREQVRKAAGLEDLVLPHGEGDPPRWKVAVLTWAAVFACVVALDQAAGPLLARLPYVVAHMLSAAVIVAALAYVIMPALTSAFAGWLKGGR